MVIASSAAALYVYYIVRHLACKELVWYLMTTSHLVHHQCILGRAFVALSCVPIHFVWVHVVLPNSYHHW